MAKIQNFNEALEKSLGRLTTEIKERQQTAESRELPEREIVKQSIKSLSEKTAPAAGAAPIKGDESVNLPNYLQGKDIDEKIKAEVEHLIEMVFSENIEKALAAAKGKPPFIEDAFHDALVDKLLPELKNRGIIKSG